jgi:dolichyl-diphosphooligosaccharide--protein glycosyltransferase
LPVAAYVVFRVASDVRVGDSPLQANAWTLGALAVAAGLAILLHIAFGWSGVYRAVAPALLLAGSLVVVGIGELAARREIVASTVLGLEVVGSILVGGVAWVAIPDVRQAGEQGIAYFLQTGQTEITETRSLLSPEFGVITTPIFYLGLTFFLAVAALVWAGWRVKQEHRPTWLALTTYTGTFFLLALVQLRFAGQFGILAAVFAGLGFVYLVAAVDITSYPRPFETDSEPPESPLRERISQSAALSLPDRQAASAVVVLFLLIGSLGAVQTANGSGLVVEETSYDAATAIDAHSATAERTWPENYVFSDWGRNRVYNYYTSGQSQSYQYAQQNYESFITSREPEQWYARLSAKPTGYVVVESPEDGASAPPETMQSRLWENWGSATAEVPGTSHYRVVYANEERKVYELVSGATVVGEAQPGTEVVATAEVSVDGREFTYRNRATANPYGIYSVTVPYSGTYEISQTRVRVSEQDFQTGTRQILHDREGIAHWPFDASDEALVYDRVGGFTGEIQGATRTDGVSGQALSFDGTDDEASVASDSGGGVRLLEPNGSVTISFWMRGSLGSSASRYPTVLSQQSAENGTVWGLWARTGGADDFGIRINDQDGTPVRNFGVDTTNFSQWTHIVAVLDREAGELRLYRDGQLVATTSASELGPLISSGRLIMGSKGGRDYAPVVIDEIRIFQQAASDEDVARLYNKSSN